MTTTPPESHVHLTTSLLRGDMPEPKYYPCGLLITWQTRHATPMYGHLITCPPCRVIAGLDES